ncbi:M28 family metallopeptidase [Kribbella catacumbae]|uniref:M28 family metallopeptidase n=1 Tax=Kribbella catacumbae TaxID=460086 RepID=UPI00058DB452|nr:M28 family peptidase [Kribbella catacumbae]
MTAASPGPVVATVAGLDDASVDRMTATVKELAADRYVGRRVGTVGGQAAAQWLASRLEELGATVALDNFPVTGVKELRATPSLVYNNQPLVHRRDFAEQLTTSEVTEPLSGPLAAETADSWQDRWIVVRAADVETIARASSEGAAGLLVPRGVDEAGWMPKMIAGPATGEIPIVSVRTDLHAELAGEVTVTMPLHTITATGTSVHGDFGTAGIRVLLTAHYDGVGDDPEQRLPAAADNASGVAVALEAARILAAEPGVALSVALLDAEEAGARGSAHHAPQVPAGTYVINVDGAAQLGDAAAVEAGGPAEPLLAALDQAGRQTGVPLRAGAMASDNRRYAAAGLPAVGIGMGMPGYQTPAETPDRVDPGTLLASAGLVLATVRQLVKTPAQLGETR